MSPIFKTETQLNLMSVILLLNKTHILPKLLPNNQFKIELLSTNSPQEYSTNYHFLTVGHFFTGDNIYSPDHFTSCRPLFFFFF